MAQKLQQQLKEFGSKLENPPNTKDALIKLLKQAAQCLSELEQSPSLLILESMKRLVNAIVKPELLKHQDRDVRLLVATCICEITRVTAPEPPYSDDVLKDVFQLIVSTFSGLGDTSGPSFERRVVILETLARYRSCVVMLDLECDDLVRDMFSTFFAVAREDHPESVLTSMQKIMVVLLEESEDVQDDLLLILLSVLGRNRKDITAARKLAMNVIEQCAGKLEPAMKQFLLSSISGENRSLSNQIDYREVIFDIYCCAPQILSGIIPYLTGELLADQLEARLKAVRLVGDLFSVAGSAISEPFQPVFLEFLKRLTDRVVEVRMLVLEHVKACMLSNPFRAEASQIISALCDRLLDYDENVRKQVVAVVCDVACHSLNSIPAETVKLVAERLRDKSLLVKNYTIERLAEIYNLFCLRSCDDSLDPNQFDWIPGKICRCFYDKDFRSDKIETILCESLFPSELSTNDKVKHWLRVFSGFDKVEVKALEKMLEQKQRLQQEMQRYLSLRQQMHQDGDAPEFQKKVLLCFRIMARWFADPAKAEENFQILEQFKDSNIWKILETLLDPKSSLRQACACRDNLLRILGEKHRIYDFLSTLSMKCSYILFNKEHVKAILLEASTQKSSGNMQLTQSCMDILVILARFSPSLLSGTEEQLLDFLKDDSEIIKEGILNVLAKAGGTIREKLAASSSSVDLILERLCLEGSRKQAKYAVHALAAITKDDGLMSLSVLYKRLVDMMDEKMHLPAVLQSLGCIAQTAMPVFETREREIEGFIKSKILECSNKPVRGEKEHWDSRSQLCSLKIFGIKTLVKSYLPVKDAHLRLGIDALLGILKNILSFGEISKHIKSSSVDKAQLKLASAKAVLRLSKYWDHKIPVDMFHLTLRTSESTFPQARKLFLAKVHQYIKDRLLDAKYACAFLFGIFESPQPEYEEEKNNLYDIIQMCHQAKARQLTIPSGASSLMAYPEYILPYLVHALAHHPSFPSIDECKDVKAYELVYRKLYLFLSMLVHGDGDGKSEVSSEKKKQCYTSILSIFQSIKNAEDSVDKLKTKNSHGICALGLSITKRLAQKQEDLQVLGVSVCLPSMLYKLHEEDENDESLVGIGHTWLTDENVLAHFDSLQLETNGTVESEIIENEVVKDNENGNEVPLGTMMKHLKSRGSKAKKEVKMKKPESKKAENNVDILKMVREINLDNLGVSNNLNSSNGHETFASRKKTKFDMRHPKRQKRKGSDAKSVPPPKRHRSSSIQTESASKESTSKASSENSEDVYSHLEDQTSDLLVSCVQKNTNISLKSKGEGSSKTYSDEEADGAGEADEYEVKKPEVLMKTDGFKTPLVSTKKHKRKSIAGFAKCSTNEGKSLTRDVIGCKIKVWWPMDKQFYEGVVKSYDRQKKKHVVLYDDGDVEVLRLEKERWEFVESGQKPTKRLNSSKVPSREVSSRQKEKIPGASRQNKKTAKKSSSQSVRGRRTPRKNLKNVKEVLSERRTDAEFSEPESRGASELSNHKASSTSKDDDLRTGGSDEEHPKREDTLAVKGESGKEEKSVSEAKPDEHAEKSRSRIEESGGGDSCHYGEKQVEEMENVQQDSHKSEEEKSCSEEHADESSRAFKEEKDKEEQLDSEGNEAENGENKPAGFDKLGEESSDSPNSDAENSDDAPLSTWKLRVGKSVQ